MKYLAVLGRQAEISIAELSVLFSDVKQIGENLATFDISTGPAAVCFPQEICKQIFVGSPHAVSPVNVVNIDRLGGCLKIGVKLEISPLEYLKDLPEGKITLGVSDYSSKASKRTAALEALKLKKILVRHGRSVRVVENKEAVLSTATSLHNGLSGRNLKKIELIKINNEWFKVVGVQDIDAYAKRDQARPARDAKVGMLPPKLAQILINLCGPLKEGARVLDPFCGTGVVLQEAMLMGYEPYGTDIEPRMVEYSKKNLAWLGSNVVLNRDNEIPLSAPRSSLPSLRGSAAMPRQQAAEYAESNISLSRDSKIPLSAPRSSRPSSRGSAAMPRQQAAEYAESNISLSSALQISGALRDSVSSLTSSGRPYQVADSLIEQGDAMSFVWRQPIDAVACEGYLGRPMSAVPAQIKLKEEKQKCGAIILGFLKNLAKQIVAGTPVVIAMPAWLMENGKYSRLDILDEIEAMGYNVNNKSREGLLYFREGQIVARDIIILRKK